MLAVNTLDRDEPYVWGVDLLAEMFELDKVKLSLQSNLYADLTVKLKQLTGKRLQPEVFKTIRTVGDVVDVLIDLEPWQAV